MEIIKILIADDSVQIVDMMKKQISLIEGVEIVATAYDGQDEVNKIREFRPDLVFTDNQMPKLNGIDVIELIKNSEYKIKTEFVIITGDRDSELIKRANALNVIRLLNKPVEYRVIEDIIEEFKSLKESKQEDEIKIEEKIKNKDSFIKSFIKKLKGKED